MMNATRNLPGTAVEKITELQDFYAYVTRHGKLRTDDHARRWTTGTLNMLGVNLSRGVKKSLGRALPEELRKALNGVFWLAYFRDTNMPAAEFCTRVARRSRASSDPDFARYPVQAVFGALKRMIDSDTNLKVQNDLAPEISRIWRDA